MTRLEFVWRALFADALHDGLNAQQALDYANRETQWLAGQIEPPREPPPPTSIPPGGR